MFQKTIQNKYIKAQGDILEKWELFKNHFHNPSVQENIRNSKEEQYQGEFLIDLFVNILGYTKNPNPNFNLTTELKNEKDSKKADGAIIISDQVKAVIELKGTNTTDLGKVENQAFGYKNNQKNCSYVVISNFEKLRFYIDNAIQFIEFNLFTLTKNEFQLLYLLLSLDSITKDIPKKLKTESVSQEDVITKKLYKDYSVFKRELFANMCELNPVEQQHAVALQSTTPNEWRLLLFKKSQKLLDRFLFLFFAEDSYLLPPNSVREILKQWKQLIELDEEIPLYNRFKKYFGYLNTGFKGKKHDIFAYNGGLFKPDEILDNIQIDDELLYKHTQKLADYDFASEVDVNILGHVFENSLNEIEEVENSLTREQAPLSKRKKDGVFYTPKYITKYIVENTVGKLCNDKKAELGFDEEQYTNDKRKTKAKKKELKDILDTYRAWLLQITICDPACGSGAFLNEALQFLITEHRYLDELETKLLGGSLVLPNIENAILENNIFGVDINEESVEIAKLSLWLRTAQPQRKLNNLNDNIKCGNSLISPTLLTREQAPLLSKPAPLSEIEKAFNWQKEFSKVFKEKEKKAFHITTAVHDSRTSQRMIDYKVRELRDNGTRPKANPIWLEEEEEKIITQIIAEIVEEDDLNVMAYNICGDHMHLLLVCEEVEVSKIMQKIKAKTARAVNIYRGHTVPNKGADSINKGGNNNT
ncbi:MAG: transposase, partial [Flavobacteriaceae bacterium]|nr:transposase [Flavobacteriaceae bacterium]